MADPKKLVLSATLDVRDVGAKARQATAEINAMKRAAADGPGVRGGRKLPSLGASDAELDAFYGPAPKLMEQSRKNAERFRLEFKRSTGEVKSLGQAIKQLPNLTEALGIYGLRGITNLITGLPRLGTALLSIARGIGVVGGIAAGAVGVAGAYGIGRIVKARKDVAAENSSTAATTEANEKRIQELKDRLEKAGTSGALRGAKGEDLRDEINRLEVINANNRKTKSDLVRSLTAEDVFNQLFRLQSRFDAAQQVSFATEEEGARQAADARVEIRAAEIENERALIRRSLDLIAADQSLTEAKRAELTRGQYAKLRKLSEEEAQSQKQQLDLQEQQLRDKLKREEGDREAQAKTNIEIDAIATRRRVLDAQAGGSLDAINADENQRLRDNLARAPRQRQSSDALQRLGLFRGGTDTRTITLSQQQLTTLRMLLQATRELPGRIKI